MRTQKIQQIPAACEALRVSLLLLLRSLCDRQRRKALAPGTWWLAPELRSLLQEHIHSVKFSTMYSNYHLSFIITYFKISYDILTFPNMSQLLPNPKMW
jgi:hypothetical protein